MSVSEQDRHELFRWLEEAMGRDRAATMMDLLPPVGWGDVATRQDLSISESRINVRLDHLDQRMDRFDDRMDRFEGRMERFETALRDQARSYVTWLLASQASVIGLLGTLIAVT